jgi:hypothetical protein
MPDYAATDNRGEVYFHCQAVAMLFIGEEICGQGQTTPYQHRHQALRAERTNQSIEGHRRDMADDRTPLYAEPTVYSQQGIASHLRSDLAIAQDDVRQHGEHHFAPRTVDAPDGETTQPDPDIMGVTGQAPAAATGRFVCELKADGQDEGQHTFETCIPISTQLNIECFILKINGDGAVFMGRFGWA